MHNHFFRRHDHRGQGQRESELDDAGGHQRKTGEIKHIPISPSPTLLFSLSFILLTLCPLVHLIIPP